MYIVEKLLYYFKFIQDLSSRTSLQSRYRKLTPRISSGSKKVVLVEGLWDNPNHWMRLWIFLNAYLEDHEADVIGILRSSSNWDNWKKRESLKSLGIKRFLYLDESNKKMDLYQSCANELLSGITQSSQILELELPGNLPAYTFFDTVLKIERQPQLKIDNNLVWRDTLAEMLYYYDFFQKFFKDNEVLAVVSSHAWKSEYAVLCWVTLGFNIPFYYMTAHYNSIRIRKMNSQREYQAPNEHLSFTQFTALSNMTQKNLIERGKIYMKERFNSESDFIVLRYSVKPEQRGLDRTIVLKNIGLDPSKELIVIYAHSWFDFPHVQAMKNFTEPLDWLMFTLDVISSVSNVNWAIKPHPCDQWYDTIHLETLINNLPSHITLLPENSDSLAIQSLAQGFVTIHGTIAIEAVAEGKKVLCADRSMYTDWGFTHTAESRDDYRNMLRNILELSSPTQEQSQRAFAFAATSLAPAHFDKMTLKIPCDTRFLDGTLYAMVKRLLTKEMHLIKQEIENVRKWLDSGYHSYNCWKTVKYCSRTRPAETGADRGCLLKREISKL